MPSPARFRAAGDRAAARLRKRAEWAFTAAQRRAAHDRAYEQWITGALAPYRITRALDAAELCGPDVDIACGAQEPAVDEWEAGTRYPSFEQLHTTAPPKLSRRNTLDRMLSIFSSKNRSPRRGLAEGIELTAHALSRGKRRHLLTCHDQTKV